MTKQPSGMHLIERAAQRLLETDDQVAAQLLGRQPADPQNRSAGPSQARVADPAPAVTEQDAAGRLPAAQPAIDAETLKRAGMIDWTLDRDRLSEEFRIVQGQVLQAMATTTTKAPALANIVMLTSAKPGEGKTFSSLNLAGSLASCSPQKVILVDVDVKRHSLTSRLGLKARPGLLDLASTPGLGFTDVLLETSLPNLRIMPAGHSELQDSLTGGKPFIAVLDRLGRSYPDCIIVLDTSPCLSSSDPSTLAPFVGQVVMLVEAQQTQRAEVEAALDLVEACPAVMLLLNKVQLTGSDTFGAYDY